MILIADGGSTKADWIALNDAKEEKFKVRTLGLNPAVVPPEVLKQRVLNSYELLSNKEEFTKIYFYGAGCGTDNAVAILSKVLEEIFSNAEVIVKEDMVAAVYAASEGKPSIVCILGTGSNSCYFDGKNIFPNVVSLGFIIMDEASGNYFGKRLLREYFYKRMPKKMAERFEEENNLDPDFIKYNLYRQPNPNTYLANFASFMFDYKDEPYIKRLMKSGFDEFFASRILPYEKGLETPIYFIGSIAFYFSEILDEVAQKYNLKITGIIQRPIQNLVNYHKKLIEAKATS